MAEPSLSVDGLTVSLSGKTVVTDVSLTLAAGHVLALVGPNGAGKSTVLRAIAGLLPHRGTVALSGETVPAEPAERAHHLAYVPQQSRLTSPMLVRDVVGLGRFQHQKALFGHARSDDAIIAEALERTRTTQLANRPFTSISLGEQRRVLVARALATEAHLLLLDEPDAFLDVGQVVAVEALIRDLAARGHAIVVVLHSLDVARRVADVCALLDGGRIRAFGPPHEVIAATHVREAYGVELHENRALGYSATEEAS